ncbi:MAG: Flp family type IVb pilin [Comamonadaceae bacterium]|jgi:pilus assembly protein Flp/PilA|nr:Flp family type IVb pilin [Comamonadaceae bacterium]
MEQQHAPQHRLPSLADESAVTAIEYGLLAALIGLAILGAIAATGSSLAALYQYWSAAVVAAL